MTALSGRVKWSLIVQQSMPVRMAVVLSHLNGPLIAHYSISRGSSVFRVSMPTPSILLATLHHTITSNYFIDERKTYHISSKAIMSKSFLLILIHFVTSYYFKHSWAHQNHLTAVISSTTPNKDIDLSYS